MRASDLSLPSLESSAMRKVARRSRATELLSKALIWVLLVAIGIALMVPMYVMVAMSLKGEAELAQTSPWSWPRNPSLSNYLTVLRNPEVSFALLAKNTGIIAVLSTLGTVLSAATVAYGFARIEFRGRDRLFILLLSTMMLPGVVTMIPTYVLFKYLHWVNTFYPLWVPSWLGGGAFFVFLLRQFFLGIPRELDESARLDGASHPVIFWHIILPLAAPALATVAIFAFSGSWRDFMGPLLYLNDTKLQTLEVGLQTYNSLNSEQWHLLMPAAVLVMLPLILIFILGQRHFIKGIVMTGGK